MARTDNIGDVVLTAPLFRAIRARLPDATLGLLASPAGATAAPLLPWVDEVTEVQPVWQDLGSRMPFEPARERSLVERLAGGSWDAAIIATSFNQTPWPLAYACYLAGIPIRVGFARDFGGSVLSHPVPSPEDELHHALRNVRLLAPLGIPAVDTRPEVVPSRDALAAARRRLARLGAEVGEAILVVPGASATARRPDPALLGSAAGMLGRATGRPVVVVGTPRERGIVATCLAASPGATDAGDDLGVPEFAALVGSVGLVLCANSAALHLADAAGIPVVAAFAGTDIESQWAPRRAPNRLLSLPVACSPCYRIDCPIGNACLRLDPVAIARAGLDLLAERRTGPGGRPIRRPDREAACVA